MKQLKISMDEIRMLIATTYNIKNISFMVDGRQGKDRECCEVLSYVEGMIIEKEAKNG